MKQLSIYETDYLEDLNTHQLATTSAIQLSNNYDSQPRDAAKPEHKANVTEIIIAKDKVDSIQILLPMLTKLNEEKRWLAWIDPPIQLLKHWRNTHNELATEEIMILRSGGAISAFELSKKALEAGTCHAVIAWTKGLNQDEFEQLEQASSDGNSHGIILRSR